ncbi:MAG: PepSY domain-containing protein, partial [Lachnospiraceae bacterium]|nr:PepSY domain-containing protein [Lachnospiraceae bacterium]
MKKGLLTAGIIACILGTGSLGAYAAGQIAQSNSISAETARNFAFVDAGVLPDDVEFEKTDFDFEKGKFVYDIEFYANGTDYDYTVDASTGMILKRESEVKVQSAANAAASKAAAQQGATPAQDTKAPAAQTPPKQNAALIGIEKAKEIALADVGKKADDVIFSKAKQEYDNGRLIYDVEFYVNGVSEHEYEIDAVTGAVLEKSSEPWEREDALTVQRAAQQTQS